MRFKATEKTSMLLLALASLLVGVGAAMAQGASAVASGSGRFGDSVDVRIVELQVVVRQKGEHVAGLGARDFTLQVDGQPVAIEHFAEVRPAGDSTGEVPGTDFLVFVDDFYSISADRNRLLRGLLEQLDLLNAKDRLALVAFDGRQLQQLSGWTRSPEVFTAAVEQAVRRPSFGLRIAAERRQVDALRGPLDGDARRGFAGIGFRGSRLAPGDSQLEPFGTAPQMRRTVRAAAASLRALVAPENRQVMLLLAGAWPVCDDRFDDGGCEGGRPQAGNSTLLRLFAPLIEDANRLGFTLYPIDVAGRGRGFGGSAGRSGATAARLREDRFEDALIQLASRTGGEAWIDGAGLRALERTTADCRSFYSLGFEPSWRADDSRHRLRVEVVRRGAEVRARRSFVDLSRSAEVARRIDRAQLFDRPLDGVRALGVVLGEPGSGARGRQQRTLRLELPLEHVTLLPGGNGWRAELELQVAASGTDGPLEEIPKIQLEVLRSSPPEPGETWIRETELRIRPDARKLWVTVFDPLSGDLFSRQIEIEP